MKLTRSSAAQTSSKTLPPSIDINTTSLNDSMTAASHSFDMQDLQAELETSQATVNALTSALTELQTDLRDKHMENEALRQTIQTLHQNVATLEQHLLDQHLELEQYQFKLSAVCFVDANDDIRELRKRFKKKQKSSSNSKNVTKKDKKKESSTTNHADTRKRKKKCGASHTKNLLDLDDATDRLERKLADAKSSANINNESREDNGDVEWEREGTPLGQLEDDELAPRPPLSSCSMVSDDDEDSDDEDEHNDHDSKAATTAPESSPTAAAANGAAPRQAAFYKIMSERDSAQFQAKLYYNQLQHKESTIQALQAKLNKSNALVELCYAKVTAAAEKSGRYHCKHDNEDDATLSPPLSTKSRSLRWLLKKAPQNHAQQHPEDWTADDIDDIPEEYFSEFVSDPDQVTKMTDHRLEV